tara:strand:+ start:88 stop:258 length:171 start_codon:yes stop_codon:yes gene_type:complete
MADGGGFDGLSFLILMWITLSIAPNLRTNNDYLKSIDKKMHTHASDGSINGIRGWY